MTVPTSKEEFLQLADISEGEWSASLADWDCLAAIGRDHDKQRPALLSVASTWTELVQQIPGVHSVRSRVKDTVGLLKKIVRKKLAGAQDGYTTTKEGYRDVSPLTYADLVTDLVGVRILHLFKDQALEIDKTLKAIQQLEIVEGPIVYMAQHDSADLRAKWDARNVKPRDKEGGYRSVHYILRQPSSEYPGVQTELQVRTLFEEAWSEMDHLINYPMPSASPTVRSFLALFNGQAHAADDMASFLQQLDVYTKVERKRADLAETIANGHLEEAKQIAEGIDANPRVQELLNEIAALRDSISLSSQLRRDESAVRTLLENSFSAPTRELLGMPTVIAWHTRST